MNKTLYKAYNFTIHAHFLFCIPYTLCRLVTIYATSLKTDSICIHMTVKALYTNIVTMHHILTLLIGHQNASIPATKQCSID